MAFTSLHYITNNLVHKRDYLCTQKKSIKIFFSRYYKQATKLDESSVLALSGIISCQLRERQFDVAREQLDFLKEIQASPGATGGASANNKSEILYMSAVLGRQTG